MSLRRSTVSRRLLVQIEQAESKPSLATLLKLAAALDVTLTELLSEQTRGRSPSHQDRTR